MLIDCHTHTNYSPDSQAKLEDMVETAVKRGIGVYGITDHCDVLKFKEQDYFKLMKDCAEHVKRVRETVPIKLLTGLELGEPYEDIVEAEKIIKSYDFDCIIGSLHAIIGQPDFYFADYDNMTDDDVNQMLHVYFDELLKLVEWNGMDILAHISYPYRYIIQRGRLTGDVSYKIFDDKAIKVFKRLIENDKSLENNTASSGRSKLDYEINHYFLELYKKCGGKRISIGSDAHDVKRVGEGIETGYAMLKEIGFDAVTYYENRKPVDIKI